MLARRALIKVLLVEDNPGDVRLVRELLAEASGSNRFEVEHVGRIEEMLGRIDGEAFDVLVLDISLTGARGIEAVVRAREAAPGTPIVVLSGLEDEEIALRALQAGAEDCLIKGWGGGELMARSLRYAVERKRAEQEIRHLDERLEEQVRDHAQLSNIVSELRESEELYNLVIEGANDAIWHWDLRAGTLYWNSRFYSMLGLPQSKFTPTIEGFYDLVHPEDRQRVSEITSAHLERNAEYYAEFRLRHSSGEYRYCFSRGSAQRDENGEPFRMAGMVSDITDRRQIENRLRRSLEVLLAVYEAGQILVSSLDLEEIGSRLLSLVRRVAHPRAALIVLIAGRPEPYVLNYIGPEEVWRSARETSEAREAERKATRTGQPQPLRIETLGLWKSPLSGLCVPLRVRNRTVGVLEVYGTERLEEDSVLEVLTSLASQVGSALENARLYGTLAERERRLEDLVEKLIVAQEEERRRVAYEVHDGLAQIAVAAHQRLQTFARRHPMSGKGAEDLQRILALVHRTVGEARRIIANLRPTALDDFGLSAAIRLELDALRDDGWKVEYEEDLGEERLTSAAETAIFRVAQEALTNARKHAGTERIRIVLRRRAEAVRLEIQDWGRGFDPNALEGGRGPGERVGLSGMEERIGLLGGRHEVRSQRGEGTLVVAEIPLLAAEAAAPGTHPSLGDRPDREH